jgi:hypothetical protein
VVVTVGETVIDVPLPMGVPPHEVAYHCQVEALFNNPEEMDNDVELPAQIVVAVGVIVGIVGFTQQ